MKANWNRQSKSDKIIFCIRMTASVIVLVAAILQFLGIWEEAINVAVPIIGVVMLLQSIQEWNKNRVSAIVGLLAAVFIFICTFIVFFVK